jgi:peptidoglycan/xylan/chitin deacetylase (PgdA/CDA1 family)
MFRILCLSLFIAAATLWSLWQISRIESFQLFGTLISEVPTTVPVIALTIDDGPTAKYAPEILAILAEQNVKATFFVNGRSLAKNPDIGQAIVQQGHELGNHGYTHKRMVFMPPWRVAREIQDTDSEIRAMGHRGEIHFRPPYGNKLFFLPLYLSRHDRPTIMWSMAPEEHVPADLPPEALADYVVQMAEPGQIILLHPMFSSGAGTRAALPRMISEMRAAGYEFVLLSELLSLP